MTVDPLNVARLRARRTGFALLVASACAGFGLELAHAFKLAGYLDVELRRSLLTWAHAHGVGLALVLLAVAGQGIVDPGSARASVFVRAGSVLVPLGFGLASLDSYESDPGFAISLVPIGALCVVWGLARITWAVWRQSPENEDPWT
jgi:hypothetical protein